MSDAHKPTLAEIEARVVADTRAFRTEVLTTFQMLPENDALSRWREQGKIVAVQDGDTRVYPAFQLDSHGAPLPIVAELLSILRTDADRTEWDHLAWFVGANGWLGGPNPVDCLHDREQVIFAAQQEVASDEY